MKKYLFTTLLTLFVASLFAQVQKINLPRYKAGQYECDTIYQYLNTIPAGKGTISVNNFKFVTGLKFYIVIDSVVEPAVWDSLGQTSPLIKGNKRQLPVKFYGGKIGFHLTIEGTPEIAGESYACDLGFYFTLGEDFGMGITTNTQKTCIVDQIQGIRFPEKSNRICVYPNPAMDHLRMDGNLSHGTYIIYDALGKSVQSGMFGGSEQDIDIHGLLPGNYLIQIGSEQQTLKFVKKEYRTE